MLNGQAIKVWRTKVVKGGCRNIEPGKVVLIDDGQCTVKCGEDIIMLLETEPAITLTAGDYL